SGRDGRSWTPSFEAPSSRWRLPAMFASRGSAEARRQQRQAFGRHIARGVWSAISEVAMFLGFTLYGLAKVRTQLLGPPQKNLRYLALPVVFTVGIMGLSLNRSLSVRDNLPLLWGKTWIALLAVWELWLYEPPSSQCPGQEGEPSTFMTTQEQIVLGVFLSLEAVTVAVWTVQKTYPFLATFCRTPLALRFFWRVRPSTYREGYSYLPNGCCCSLRRKHFKYHGDQDFSQLPHGHGIWQDDSYHGEVYEGSWFRGQPVAPFVSRCFGSGAISCGLKVGYGTARLEELSEVFRLPQRALDGCFRFGSLGVECSASGAFLAHLPQRVVGQHQSFADASGLIVDLRASVPRPRLSDLDLAAPGDDARSAAASFCSDAGDSQTAFVFVHGYNCPTDWACLRLGQLMTLGKFSSRFLPFVFSWPTGTIASFFHVRRHLDQFAGDLAEFLHRLHESGIQEFHLMAHSMGCELVCAALDHLEQLPARGRPATTGGTDELPRAKIATISFCNPSCPLNAFLEGSPSNLARLAALCQRLTFYVDREDTALWAGEVLGGHGRALGRFAEPLPSIYDSSLTPKIDVVDCTSMDANVNGIRHSYFDLNAYLVSDLHELVSKGTPANRRSRLVRTSVSSRSNVFSFLAPPVFVNW
ncbi:unnamed protein product, partial [Symbiodinium microadriaticum]